MPPNLSTNLTPPRTSSGIPEEPQQEMSKPKPSPPFRSFFLAFVDRVLDHEACQRAAKLDHPYFRLYGSRESTLDRNHPNSVPEKEMAEEANEYNRVREINPQFLLGSNVFSSPLQISSFDVAQIEILNADGTPVDKMQEISSCHVHVQDNELCRERIWHTGPSIKPQFPNALKSIHLRSIDNRVNDVPKSLVKNEEKSLDYSENGENVNKKRVLKLIDDLDKKKKTEPPICEICGNRFTAVATLKNHYRSHGNIKLHQCSLCSRSFSRRTGLKYHMQIHNNKYRYTCSVCSRQFRHTTHFKTHCRDHSCGEPVQCTLCSHYFKNQNTLSRHYKTRHTKKK